MTTKFIVVTAVGVAGLLGATGVGLIGIAVLAYAVGGRVGGALGDNTETILSGGTSTTGDIAGSCASGAFTSGL